MRPGETVALVGHTGSGKTSIINLLMRFYDPTGGAVRVDGHDLRDVQVEACVGRWRLCCKMGSLFRGPLRRISDTAVPLPATPKSGRRRRVRLHEFISTLEDGYNHDVGERGGRISVGQRQLLAFARALLADPRILILDEATSSVDTETERVIQQAMETLLQGRTAFIIAHRLSTIRHADRIMVIDHDRIVEWGTHESCWRNTAVTSTST
ncbi:MAG: ATP-binding cassette domain-containing protein [Chloroflexota bacterium]